MKIKNCYIVILVSLLAACTLEPRWKSWSETHVPPTGNIKNVIIHVNSGLLRPSAPGFSRLLKNSLKQQFGSHSVAVIDLPERMEELKAWTEKLKKSGKPVHILTVKYRSGTRIANTRDFTEATFIVKLESLDLEKLYSSRITVKPLAEEFKWKWDHIKTTDTMAKGIVRGLIRGGFVGES